jgi:hypothetical protein
MVLAFGFRRFGFWISVWLFFLAAAARAQMPIEGDVYAHDPSTMIKEGDRFHLFRTSVGILGKYSTDLRHWTNDGKVFPDEPPAWTRTAVKGFVSKFWAPDVAFVNGKYHLYYSCSTFGKQVSVIGLVTSPSLNSPYWTDQGAVIQSTVGDPNNCIDPGILVETNGSMWMVFGSFFDGLFLTQLDPATGKRIATNSPVTRVAHNGASAFQNTTEAPLSLPARRLLLLVSELRKMLLRHEQHLRNPRGPRHECRRPLPRQRRRRPVEGRRQSPVENGRALHQPGPRRHLERQRHQLVHLSLL